MDADSDYEKVFLCLRTLALPHRTSTQLRPRMPHKMERKTLWLWNVNQFMVGVLSLLRLDRTDKALPVAETNNLKNQELHALHDLNKQGTVKLLSLGSTNFLKSNQN